MRTFVHIVLIFSILSAYASDFSIYLGFKLNQTYLASSFCVQREIPDSDCEGTCYLSAQLEQASSTSTESPPLAILLEQTVTITAIFIRPSSIAIPYAQRAAFCVWQDPKPAIIPIESVFHPPRG